ncbi:MAG: methionine--tRNA ligase [Spirochaetaceae bacterium]|nr:methionine--tRNA ligase [Spirochaetaceae bacterium]
MKKRLITSALPYVNNIPHLGNLIQVLSADVFARFCRLKGYDTIYVCGTDEYGTATETKALEEGITPKELCDKFYVIHKDIYEWFHISFDKFGRTSTKQHTEITQSLFHGLDKNKYINEKTIEQLYCTKCQRFLADRYVKGTCPSCAYEDARGDQCEHCGKLLDPTELVKPRCGVCQSEPVIKSTKHLYINLPDIVSILEPWINKRSVEGFWSRNALQMTKSWIRDGLRERGITRDLKWGIPVPKEGFEDKVFYVWFDAPIGYISITATLMDDWEKWWKNPDNVQLFQFIGKDNIPFHTVIFPSTLLGSDEEWTTLYHMSSTEYLNYESGKFSKSKGIGVFGTDCKDSGIPADVWRFYIFYNRPEKSDYLFTWKDFQEKVNSELIGNLGNLINRTLTFAARFFNSEVIEGDASANTDFWNNVKTYEEKITAHLDRAELKDAYHVIFELSAFGNKIFQDSEPWKMKNENPEKAHRLISDLVYLVRDLALLIQPYTPYTSEKILSFIDSKDFTWDKLGKPKGKINKVNPEILFTKLEDDLINNLREKFKGSQKERGENVEKSEGKAVEKIEPKEKVFAETVDLRVAKIKDIKRHPEAEKLYIEILDMGNGEERQIVSGLVPFYKEEELLGHNIIVAYNLKPAKLRGVESNGMLLCAEDDKTVEVIFAPDASPGDRVVPAGYEAPKEEMKKISIDKFFETPLEVKDNIVYCASAPLALACGSSNIKTEKVSNGKVR